MRKKNIDISTEEKKNEVFNLLNNFNSKTEAYRYFGLSDNAVNSKYLTNIAEQIGFDLNIYKERRKKPIKYCQECGKEITSRDGKLFCSSSCAAKYNNKHRDKSVYEKLAAKLRKKDKADKPKKEKQVKDGVKFDIAAIREAGLFLSFFDVCNHINWYNTDISPTPTEKLKNDFSFWYRNNVLRPIYQF